jgi:hypothetical protein
MSVAEENHMGWKWKRWEFLRFHLCRVVVLEKHDIPALTPSASINILRPIFRIAIFL